MIIAAILAGGKGLRLGSEIPKQLLPLGSKTVIQWTVDTFHNSRLIDEIIIVSEKSYMDNIREIFDPVKYHKITAIIEGGRERVDSSARAVFHKEYSSDDIFLIHDAARPFISMETVFGLIEAVREHGAAGVYIPAKDTVAVVRDGFVESIPDRSVLCYAQTPQAFRYGIIAGSHRSFRENRSREITDDVSLVKANGHSVGIVYGSDLNFKITTESDYRIAVFMAENGMV